MAGSYQYFVYPVSEKQHLLRHGITYPHIQHFSKLVKKNPHLIRHVHEQVPAIMDSIKKSCYTDSQGHCIDTSDLVDCRTFPKSLSCKTHFHQDILRQVMEHDPIRQLHKMYSPYSTSDVFANQLLLGLAMPRVGCTCNQSGGAEYVEGSPLTSALDKKNKDYQSIYAITLMGDNGSTHRLIAKITTKLTHHYSDYAYEEKIYDFLNRNGDSSKKYPLLKYYGTVHTPLKSDGIIHTEHAFDGIGKVTIDIDLKPDMNMKYLIPGTEAIVLLFENVSDTHIDTETYVRAIRKTKSSKETANRCMRIYKMVGKELLNLNHTFHLVHGDFHMGNCFMAKDGKSIIIYDFNLSYFPGFLDNSLFLYPVYKHYKSYIADHRVFNKLSAKEQERILNELYCIDMVRYYGYLSYYSKIMFFEEHYTNPVYQVQIKTNNRVIDLTHCIYLAYSYFQRKFDSDRFGVLFDDTNGFMMSMEYFRVIFSFVDILDRLHRFNKKTPIGMNLGDFIQRHIDRTNKDPDWDYGMTKKQKTDYLKLWKSFDNSV
jgi:hypothetical protein